MEKQLKLRVSDRAGRRMFYGWMEKQFPPDELKPLSAIEALCERGIYDVYGLWNGNAPIAYAALGHAPDGRCHLLDYYAVLPEYQNSGWGGRFLAMLHETLPGDAILLEVDDPDYAENATEREMCHRRIAFYERHGCTDTGERIFLFGVHYRIMMLPMSSLQTDARARMEEIYHCFLPDNIYRMQVHFKDEEHVTTERERIQ